MTIVGPYRVIRALGAGGMGEVFLAEDTRLHRQVALKALQVSDGADAARRIMREARAAARLNHPNIAAVYDVLEQDGRPYIVMEYVEGQPLTELIGHGPLPVDRVVEIGIDLAEAVAFAHRQGVVHRDIKPGNVMLTSAGAVKLLDLGIARVTDLRAGDGVATDPTTTGMPLAGTPAYMAPELMLGGEAGPLSDIYSLGTLLFELLTGRRPFEDPDPMGLVMAMAAGQAPRVEALRPGIPQQLGDVIADAIARDPAERVSSAAELRDRLVRVKVRQARTRTVDGLDLPGAAEKQGRRLLPLLVTSGIVAVLLALLYTGLSSKPTFAPGPVAVLPAVNLSGDPELEAIGVGLMSTIAANLDAATGITAVPQSAATTFRGEDRDLAKAAGELGTPYLIDVRLQKGQEEITAAAKLVRAGVAEPLWSATVTGGLLKIQQEILDGLARTLASAGLFSAHPSGAQLERLRALPTASTEAFEAYARGSVLLDKRDAKEATAAAQQEFERALQHDPQFALAHAAASQAAVAMYRHSREPHWLQRALDLAQRAMEIEPASGQVQHALAEVYRATGRPADAVRHLEMALRRSPDLEASHRLMGQLLLDQGKYDEAVRALQQAIALRPGYYANHHSLGITHFRAGRYQEAIRSFTEVTRLRPDYHGGYQALGTAHHYAGNIDEAIGNYAQSVRVRPSAEAHGNLGYVYYVSGRFDEALAMFTKAVELGPTSASAHRNLGDVLMRMDRTEEARRAYLKAIALAEGQLQANPRDVALLGILALSEARLGRLDSALRHSAAALALAPEDSDAIYNHAAVSALGGRDESALKHLARALELGYPRQLAREDDYFARLANKPEYKALVNPDQET